MNRNAYTLLELLIVIVVIGILISILLPALGYARRVAQSGRCMGNLHAIARGFHMYADDNTDSAPDENSNIAWDEQMAVYVRDRDAFRCPSDRSVTVRETGLSYDWRNTTQAGDFSRSMSRVNLKTAGPGDLVLVFEIEFNWHHYDEKIVGRLDTSVISMESWRYFENMHRSVR